MTTLTKNKGAVQHAASQHAKSKSNNLLSYYHNHLLPVSLAEQQFRVTALLPKQQKKISLNGYMQELSWQDLSTQAWLQGNLTLQGVEDDRDYLAIGHGDVVRNEVLWDGKWLRLWDMRIWDPDRTLSQAENVMSVPIYDDLYLLSLSEDDFHYAAHKGGLHPHGWKCHEILIDICRKYRIPVGKIAAGTYLFKNFDEMKVSPIDAIIRAYQTERNHSGRRFVLRWNNGKLEVTPLRRNPVLYELRQQIIDATLHHTTPSAFATVLAGRGTLTSDTGAKDSNGHNKTKTHKGVFVAKGQVANYGFIHKMVEFSHVSSMSELERKTKHDLAQREKIGHGIDFDHEGIAVLRKGDAARIVIPQEGYTGAHSIVWISDITHTLSPGSYIMTPTVTSDDPLTTASIAKESKSTKKRATARVKRASKSKNTGPQGTTDPNKALQEMLKK